LPTTITGTELEVCSRSIPKPVGKMRKRKPHRSWKKNQNGSDRLLEKERNNGTIGFLAGCVPEIETTGLID
jgi:hypothetical protein